MLHMAMLTSRPHSSRSVTIAGRRMGRSGRLAVYALKKGILRSRRVTIEKGIVLVC